MSLAGQIFAVLGLCLVLTAAAALIVTFRFTGERGAVLRLELIGLLSLGVIVSIAIVMVALRSLLLNPLEALDDHISALVDGKSPTATSRQPMPSRDLQRVRTTLDRMIGHLQTARGHFEQAQRTLADRTSTVDRLLDFSQTVQGAGTLAQVFDSLAHYVRTELGLSGVVIISNEPDQTPAMQLRAAWPADLVQTDAVADLESAACPCLRQHLPRTFRPGGSPIRCAVDACLSLGPEHPAHCIPFNVGQRMQVVVHMLLPIAEVWTEERKQLAQTYVNTAISTLISMHLLAEAEKESITDGLTGLYNRRSLESLLQREVALAERHSHPLSLVIIDLDKFKQVNDAHGHAAGDHLLKSFADCVRITLRKTDLAFRYGGDEFVIALPQTPVAQAMRVVNKLRQAFGAVDFSHAIANLEHQPTLSIGIAERSIPQNVVTLQNLLSAADQALYDAKANNRNCVKVYAQHPTPKSEPTKPEPVKAA
jgi:diguanylate cyclase (GGDEF)-like protein